MKTFFLRLLGIVKLWPEALQAVSILAGWALMTFGIASLSTWQVWPISIGLLLFSLVGWGHLRFIFGKGIYTLSRNRNPKKVARG